MEIHDDSEAVHKVLKSPVTLQVGDYVVYEYRGSCLMTPVVLQETVLARNGDRLTIEVEAKRGSERRRWLQIVMDTPENRDSGTVEELYEIENGRRKSLQNDDDKDVRRLYAWVLPPHGRGRSASATRAGLASLARGKTVRATFEEHTEEIDGHRVRVIHCQSPHFEWQHVSLVYVDLDTRDELYSMRVLNWGQRTSERDSDDDR